MGAALELALDDEAQARALDAADREEVGSEAARGKRDGACERCAPDQVDVLAGGGGVSEFVGEVVELTEKASLDLLLGQRGVAGAPERAGASSIQAANNPSGSIPWPAGAPHGQSARLRGRSR